MAELSKLQIRAKVLSVISEIKSINNYDEELLKRFINELQEIDDRKTIFDVFLKEFIKMSENEYMFSGLIIKSLVPVDYVQEKVFDILKQSSYSDEAKYKLVQLLRSIGSNSAYDAIPQYFDNPEEVIDMETQKLLEKAVINPEAMLDFLDFVYAVPKNDKKLLLQSLQEDYKGDVLANIVYPILYSDFDDDFKLKVIDVLAESKSSLAIEAFNYLIKISDNSEIISACEKGLKKLKLAGASEEKALEYFINAIKDTKPAESYTTIPDGNGNQALLVSRVSSANKYIFEAVVINDNYGVVDCFGFYNISKSEFDKIVNKFYKSDGQYKVSPEYVKSRINHSIDVSIAKKRVLPYEFVCWNILTKDIKPLDNSITELVDKSIELKTFEKDIIFELLTKSYTLHWFVKADEVPIIKQIADEFYSAEVLNRDLIKNGHDVLLQAIFDEETIKIWKDKLYNLVYLLSQNSQITVAEMFYFLIKDESLFNSFKSILVQRSIFNHLFLLRENQKQSALTINIFKKRNTSEFEYDSKKLTEIIDILKKSWIDE